MSKNDCNVLIAMSIDDHSWLPSFLGCSTALLALHRCGLGCGLVKVKYAKCTIERLCGEVWCVGVVIGIYRGWDCCCDCCCCWSCCRCNIACALSACS